MFKLSIGDLVTHVTAADGGKPIIGVVMEQHTQTCPGGTQYWYSVRFGLSELKRFLDIELVKFEGYAEDPIDVLDAAKQVCVIEKEFETADRLRKIAGFIKSRRMAAKEPHGG